jgi:hypothetical protein
MFRQVNYANLSQREIYRREYCTCGHLLSYRTQQLKLPLENDNGIRATQF